MSSPLCPNCLERMSATEAGLGGVWSCLYCEATWLPAHRVSSLLGVVEASRSVPESSTLAHAPSPTHGMLVCPQCHAKSFHLLTSAPSEAYLCVNCSSVFLQKGASPSWRPKPRHAKWKRPPHLWSWAQLLRCCCLIQRPSYLRSLVRAQPRVRPNPSFKRTCLRHAA